jgi:hypothetical protein
MFKILPIAAALIMAPLCFARAGAIPLGAYGLSATSSVTPVYFRGGAVRGPRGVVAVRGPHGGVALRGGAYRVGGRYYGGAWYGHGRRFYGGRWWAYGIGSCWRSSPIR